MKKIKILLILIMSVLLSCTKDIENDTILPINSSKDLKVSDNFKWETLRDVSATLKFKTNNKSSAPDAPIEIYAGGINSRKLIFDGYTNEFGVLDSLSFKIGNYYNTIKIIHNGDSSLIPILNGEINSTIILKNYKRTKSSNNNNKIYYPSKDKYGSLVFEDLWPYYGDFDFNDLVLEYNLIVKTNNKGKVISAEYTMIPRAAGAGIKSGFGFTFDKFHPACNDYVEFSNINNAHLKKNDVGNSKQLNSESGQIRPTYIIYTPNESILNWNTIDNYVANPTYKLDMSFPANHSVSHFDFPFSNPFIFSIDNSGIRKEIHLPGKSKTIKHNYVLPSNSEASATDIYRSKSGLTWAIDIEEAFPQFKYPKEGVDILNCYLLYQTWATTGAPIDWWTRNKIENNLFN